MASIRRTLWGILGLALLLPPGAFPALGDAEQSSVNNPDHVMQPNKLDSNVGPAQSGPGAAGLFTPNSPGNAAALSAQISGGLAGSPIVDGAGVNLKISVPRPTPAQAPVYERVTNGGTKVGAADSTMGGTGPLGYVPRANPQTSQRRVPGASGPKLRGTSTRNTSTGMSYPTPGRDRRVTGSIEYQDGDVVLFGDRGILKTTSKRKVSRVQDVRI